MKKFWVQLTTARTSLTTLPEKRSGIARWESGLRAKVAGPARVVPSARTREAVHWEAVEARFIRVRLAARPAPLASPWRAAVWPPRIRLSAVTTGR